MNVQLYFICETDLEKHMRNFGNVKFSFWFYDFKISANQNTRLREKDRKILGER